MTVSTGFHRLWQGRVAVRGWVGGGGGGGKESNDLTQLVRHVLHHYALTTVLPDLVRTRTDLGLVSTTERAAVQTAFTPK